MGAQDKVSSKAGEVIEPDENPVSPNLEPPAPEAPPEPEIKTVPNGVVYICQCNIRHNDVVYGAGNPFTALDISEVQFDQLLSSGSLKIATEGA